MSYTTSTSDTKTKNRMKKSNMYVDAYYSKVQAKKIKNKR